MTEKKTTAKKAVSKSKTPTPELKAVPEAKDAPKVAIFPPILLLLTIIAGITLHWLFPMSFWFDLGSLGFIFTALGLGLVIWCKKIFENSETNISPEEPTEAIVTTGPFKYSRNPIYAGFLVIFTGLSLMSDAPVMLALLVPLFYLLDQKIIAPEETYLEEKFGADYTDYKDVTPRWLSFKR